LGKNNLDEEIDKFFFRVLIDSSNAECGGSWGVEYEVSKLRISRLQKLRLTYVKPFLERVKFSNKLINKKPFLDWYLKDIMGGAVAVGTNLFHDLTVAAATSWYMIVANKNHDKKLVIKGLLLLVHLLDILNEDNLNSILMYEKTKETKLEVWENFSPIKHPEIFEDNFRKSRVKQTLLTLDDDLYEALKLSLLLTPNKDITVSNYKDFYTEIDFNDENRVNLFRKD